MPCMQLPLIIVFWRLLYYFALSGKPYMMLSFQIALHKLCKPEGTEQGQLCCVAAYLSKIVVQEKLKFKDKEAVREFLLMDLESW